MNVIVLTVTVLISVMLGVVMLSFVKDSCLSSKTVYRINEFDRAFILSIVS